MIPFGKSMAHGRGVAILTYHSLDESGSVLSTEPDLFAEQMRILHESGVKVIPLSAVRDVLGGGLDSQRCLAITFDDGFMNLYHNGFPVLLRYGFPATVFLVTDYCGKENDWPSQPRAVKRWPLLGWREIDEMAAAGITFGAHTRTHPDLRTLAPKQVKEEILPSKKSLEDALGRSVDLFAYPYGVYNERVRKISQELFSLCCSTKLDFVKRESDLFSLERLDMYYFRSSIFFGHLFSRRTKTYIHLRRWARNLRGGWGHDSSPCKRFREQEE